MRFVSRYESGIILRILQDVHKQVSSICALLNRCGKSWSLPMIQPYLAMR